MDMPQIHMQSQMARIAIEKTDGRQSIKQPRADVSIEQPRAEVSIQTEPGKLTIDQSKAWADMNLLPITELNKQHAQAGIQAAKKGTARRAQQGSELMKIENEGNPLIRQAQENSSRSKKQLGLEFIPESMSVDIHYEPAQVNIDVDTHSPRIHATPQKVIHHYTPGRVTTRMDQHPELEIDFVLPNQKHL